MSPNVALRQSQRAPENELEAWLAGLLATDGYIKTDRRDKNNSVLTLTAARDDPAPLELIARHYGKSLPPSHQRGSRKPTYELRLPKVPLHWRFEPPEMDSTLVVHYIRGLMDGDGCVTKTRGRIRAKFLWVAHEYYLGDYFRNWALENDIALCSVHPVTHNTLGVWVREQWVLKFLRMLITDSGCTFRDYRSFTDG